jgi:hypothetical protein
MLLPEILASCLLVVSLLASLISRFSSWSTVAVVLGSLFLVGTVACVVSALASALRARQRDHIRAAIESRYPDARVDGLSTGHWLITDRASGHTRCELAPHGGVGSGWNAE